jgi:hydroxymethylpyrimidine pyrophosphatase-like HAD family hydrolase
VRLLVERARSGGHVLELYSDTEYAVESAAAAPRAHAELLGLPFAPRAFETLSGPVVRAQWLLRHEEVTAMLARPHPELEVAPSTSPVMPETMFINMTPAGVNKASGVRTVAAAYDLSMAEVMMVGDGHNDLEALRAVGFPVAMGNAEPAVRAAARLQVGHVDEGGLVEAIAAALAE